MNVRWGWMFLLVALGGDLSEAAPAVPAPGEMVEVARDQMDRALLTPRATRLADAPEFKWKQAQTEHFVIHFENGIFAAKVARLAEFFYTYISTDLAGARDQQEGRSHLFIFREQKDWQLFQKNYGPEGMEWSFSMVEGSAMYLQQADNLSNSAEVLGHEMTHLVMNRFFTGELPLWVNEGLAEWYGEFAYAAFKGIKKSKRAEFRRPANGLDPASVLAATDYPADPTQVHAFYASARHMVGFLFLDRPQEKRLTFLKLLVSGADTATALVDVYGFADAADFVKQYDKFRP